MPVIATKERQRPDIIVFNGAFAFAKEQAPFNSIVVVEFKRPARDDYTDDENPVSQVLGYIRRVRDGLAKDRAGRPLNLALHVPFYTGAWTGFVQSAGGFNTNTNPASALVGALYDMYFADMLVPDNSGCANGDSCATAIWAGIGGYNTQIWGVTLSPDLIQSGFAMFSCVNPPSPGPGTFLFTEFVPGAGIGTPSIFLPPAGDSFTTFDEFWLWGWSASSATGCSLSTTANVACFAFEDATKTWGFSGYAQNPPGDNAWLPETVDYVVENPSGYHNTYFGEDVMEGGGTDSSGGYHPDPGTAGATDPYVHVTSAAGNSGVAWDNGGTFQYSPPVDPIYFVWGAF